MAVSPLEYWLVTLWRAGKLLVANCVHARPCYKAVPELALGFRGLGLGVAVTPQSLSIRNLEAYLCPCGLLFQSYRVRVVSLAGFEPATTEVLVQRSTHLSYSDGAASWIRTNDIRCKPALYQTELWRHFLMLAYGRYAVRQRRLRQTDFLNLCRWQ